MVVERAFSPDAPVPFISTSILHARLSEDRKPQPERLTTGENGGLAARSYIAAPCPTDHPAPLSSASAMDKTSSAASAPCDPAADDGACWNLVPYDVPWGSDYYEYKQGTLPGPNGTCLFLRSPTPVEKRRTVQACQMCRERKAKCSGDKPACARCLARGYVCQYLPDAKKIKSAKAGPIRLKESRALSHPYGRRDSDTYSIASSAELSEYSYSSPSSSYFSPKQEDQEFPPSMLLQKLQYLDEEEVMKRETHPADRACLTPYGHVPPIRPEYCAHEQPLLSATSTSSSLSFWSGYESPHPPTQTLAAAPTYPSFHAPRPLRYSQSLPFLPFAERRISGPDDVIGRPRSAEPVLEVAVGTTVDPRVLTQQLMDTVYYTPQDVAHQKHGVEEADAFHADHWQSTQTSEQYSMTNQDSALLMQQYCNISPAAHYAESHPVEPHLGENFAPYHFGHYEVAAQAQAQAQHCASPTGEYGYPSLVSSTAGPAFSRAQGEPCFVNDRC